MMLTRVPVSLRELVQWVSETCELKQSVAGEMLTKDRVDGDGRLVGAVCLKRANLNCVWQWSFASDAFD